MTAPQLSDIPVVVWFDPGLTTGWARFENCQVFTSGQDQFDATGDMLTGLAELHGPRLWVGWELYNVTKGGGKSGTPKYSLETIGMLKRICRTHGATVLKPVPSASRKLGGESKLKRLGWWNPGKVHANDAASHLLAFMLREGNLPQSLLDQILAGM